MKYTESHQWVEVEGGVATIGLLEKAQKELGEIVYLELPSRETNIKKDEPVCVLESTKAAVDIYAPVSGKVVKVNAVLTEQPEQINRLKEKEKWLYQVQMSDLSELEDI